MTNQPLRHPHYIGIESRNSLLAKIGERGLGLLLRHMDRVSLKRGTVLLHTDEPLSWVWFPETCVVSLVVQMADGGSAEVAEVGHEGAVGQEAVLGLERAASQATVQIPGFALRIATRHLLPAMEQSASLRMAVWRSIAALNAQTMQSAACYALHPTRARLARVLLVMEDRLGQPSLRLTQELLAEMLGVQRTTVTAAALGLMEEGLILYKRGRIDVCDRAGLETAACECYPAFRQFCHGSPAPTSPRLSPRPFPHDIHYHGREGF